MSRMRAGALLRGAVMALALAGCAARVGNGPEGDGSARDASREGGTVTGDGVSAPDAPVVTTDVLVPDAELPVMLVCGNETPDPGFDTVPARTCEQASRELVREAIGDHPARVVTAVFRFAYQTRQMIGFQVVADPSLRMVTESDAARVVSEQTALGAPSIAPLRTDDAGNWIFYRSPSATSGGVATVNDHASFLTFAAHIRGPGAGCITFPSNWRSPRELVARCPRSPTRVLRRGYDLRTMEPLPADTLEPLVAAVMDTPLDDAIERRFSLFTAVVLLYPRSVAPFDPATAEWIVLLNGHYLE